VEALRGFGNREPHTFKACWVIGQSPTSFLRLSQAVGPVPLICRAVPALRPAQTSPAKPTAVLNSPVQVYVAQCCSVSEQQPTAGQRWWRWGGHRPPLRPPGRSRRGVGRGWGRPGETLRLRRAPPASAAGAGERGCGAGPPPRAPALPAPARAPSAPGSTAPVPCEGTAAFAVLPQLELLQMISSINPAVVFSACSWETPC